jgi:hypothetical protein
VGTMLYGGACLIGLLLAISIFTPAGELVDAIWLVLLIPFVAWNFLLRAAFVDRAPLD